MAENLTSLTTPAVPSPVRDPNAPIPHYHPTGHEWIALLAVLVLVAVGTFVLVWMRRRTLAKYAPLDTRERIDAYDHRLRGSETVLIPALVYGLPFVFCLWYWGAWINDTIASTSYSLRLFNIWWHYLATDAEKTVILVLGLAAFTIASALAFVAYYVVYRGIWPDVLRLDPDANPGGRPEPIGRLYKRREYRDEATAIARAVEAQEHVFARAGEDAKKRDALVPAAQRAYAAALAGPTHQRLYYHHDYRLLPPTCDIIDLPLTVTPRHFGIGKILLRTVRWERAPELGRRVRVLARRDVGSQPIETTWRNKDFRQSQRRAVSLVMTGASQNPDATVRKFEREATITAFQADSLEGILRPELDERPPATPRGAATLSTNEAAEADA